MEELIKIRVDQQGEKVVSAKELHAFLESSKDFTTWIKYRIEQHSFEEGVDFLRINTKIGEKSKRGRPSIDYALTIDMAKEIGMLEGNQKGKDIRRYFISVEKEWKTQIKTMPAPAIMSRLELLEMAIKQEKELIMVTQAKDLAEHKVLEANKTIAVIEEKLEQHKDKVSFADRLANDKRLFPIGSVAKLLKLNVGRNDFFEILRNDKILMSSEIEAYHNEPYQQYMQYFVRNYKDIERYHKDGSMFLKRVFQTYANIKGMYWLSKRYKGNNPEYASNETQAALFENQAGSVGSAIQNGLFK